MARHSAILAAALADARVIITRDLDFGRLALDTSSTTAGIVVLRMQPAVMDAVHAELLRALGEHPELRGTLLVVEAARHRIRRFVPPTQ